MHRHSGKSVPRHILLTDGDQPATAYGHSYIETHISHATNTTYFNNGIGTSNINLSALIYIHLHTNWPYLDGFSPSSCGCGRGVPSTGSLRADKHILVSYEYIEHYLKTHRRKGSSQSPKLSCSRHFVILQVTWQPWLSRDLCSAIGGVAPTWSRSANSQWSWMICVYKIISASHYPYLYSTVACYCSSKRTLHVV